MKRLFVIKNTTHLLNIKSYIRDKPDAENFVILTVGKFSGDQEFIRNVKNSPNLKVLEVIYIKSDSKIFDYFLVLKNILRIKRHAVKIPFFDEIIFTNYRNWIHHFILNEFNSKKQVLLSDGSGILLMAEYRKNPNVIPLESVPFKGNKFIQERFFNFKPIGHLHFYSPINLEIQNHDSVEVFRFKSSRSNRVQKNKVFFIGSPLVELNYLSLEKQLNYLAQIKELYKDADITYFSHRRERDEFLKKYEFFGKIVKSDVPFEERIEQESELPGVILSYLSSVLINLTPIYPQIQFYYIPLDEEDLAEDSNFLKNYTVVRKGFEKIKEANFSKFDFKTLAG